MQDRGAAPVDPDVTRRVAQQMVKRLIATMRDAHHGGTLLLVPRERAAGLVSEGGAIRLKYAFADEEPRRRYRSLILAVMGALALSARAVSGRGISSGGTCTGRRRGRQSCRSTRRSWRCRSCSPRSPRSTGRCC